MIWISQGFYRITVATATVPYHSDQTLSVADFRDQTFFITNLKTARQVLTKKLALPTQPYMQRGITV